MTRRAGQCVAAAAWHRRWVELLTCARCDALVCYERFDARLPPEGEQCRACGRWFCPRCLDRRRDTCAGCRHHRRR